MKLTVLNTTKNIKFICDGSIIQENSLWNYYKSTPYPLDLDVVNLEPSDGTESARNFCFEVRNKLVASQSSVPAGGGSDLSKIATIGIIFAVKLTTSACVPTFRTSLITRAFTELRRVYKEKLKVNVEMQFENKEKEKLILKGFRVQPDLLDGEGKFRYVKDLGITWPLAFFQNKVETDASIKIEIEIEDPVIDVSVLPDHRSLNRTILLDKIQCDFKIIAEDDSETHCHKVFLASRSQVFATMFGTECKETASDSIKMEISKEGVRAFLKFLYYFNIEAPWHSPNIAMDLLELGHKYDIGYLETVMKRILEANVNGWYSLDNALRLFEWCRLVKEHEDLKKKALKVIRSKRDQLLGSTRFHQLFPNEIGAEMFILSLEKA